eukprot:gb/GECG01005436.1/.p1 GENE.gb/GECG01005436.1/~~gb/GECG01005436.1/.p1  ORF type:complete len:302 (+),score=16.35 gb/GECG01005436.1/:1-906(+)
MACNTLTWCLWRTFVHPWFQLKKVLLVDDAEKKAFLETKLRKAATHSFKPSSKAPCVKSHYYGLYMSFQPPGVERAYQEWKVYDNARTILIGFSLMTLIIVYYWLSDWMGTDEGAKDLRLIIRGIKLPVLLILFPIALSREMNPRLRNYTVLGIMCLLCFLLFLRYIYEAKELLYFRSMGIWTIFFKVVAFLLTGVPSGYFLVVNAFDTTIHLVWQNFIRPYSTVSVYQWELLTFLLMQNQYYLMEKRDRDDFRLKVISWMERQERDALSLTYAYCVHFTRDIIVLHNLKADQRSYFTFVR